MIYVELSALVAPKKAKCALSSLQNKLLERAALTGNVQTCTDSKIPRATIVVKLRYSGALRFQFEYFRQLELSKHNLLGTHALYKLQHYFLC